MEPEGDAIVGVARVVSGGKTRTTEIGVMEERAEGIVLLLRNFGKGQVAREERDAPLHFVLRNLAGRPAEFLARKSGPPAVHGPAPGGPLTLTLIKVVDGKEVRMPFEYRRR